MTLDEAIEDKVNSHKNGLDTGIALGRKYLAGELLIDLNLGKINTIDELKKILEEKANMK